MKVFSMSQSSSSSSSKESNSLKRSAAVVSSTADDGVSINGAWHSKKLKPDTNTIHEAVAARKLDLVKGFLADDPTLLQQRNKSGKTPLHVAAHANNSMMVEFLLGEGADPWALDNEGLSPLFTAAARGAHAAVQMLHLAMKDNINGEQSWFTAKQMVDEFKKARPKGGESSEAAEQRVDRLVQNLAGVTSEELNDRKELFKYISHLNSWVGRTLGARAEGWYFDSVLVQRLRTLCHLVTEPLPPGKPAVVGMTNRALRVTLLREIRSVLATLKVARELDALYGIRDGKALGQVIAIQTRSLLQQALRLSATDTLTLPIGFPGHAIYMGIERRGEGDEAELVVHVNNLGAGYLNTHHTEESNHVYPMAFRVPLGVEDKFGDAVGPLVDLLSGILVCRADHSANWESLYGMLYKVQHDLKANFGEERVTIDAEDEGWKTMKAQTAGNCALKNHSASMVTRLGRSFFKWFKEQEKAYAMGRSNNMVDAKLFQEKEFEKERELLHELIDERAHVPLALRKFLSKERQAGIAKKIDEDKLALLISEGAADVLDPLLKLGANKDAEDGHGCSLLHCAVKLGAARCADVLLQHGADVNHQDERGWTPLHYAMNAQNQELVGLLVAAGADADIEDAAGKTPRDLLDEKLAEGSEIRLLLSMGLVAS